MATATTATTALISQDDGNGKVAVKVHNEGDNEDDADDQIGTHGHLALLGARLSRGMACCHCAVEVDTLTH